MNKGSGKKAIKYTALYEGKTVAEIKEEICKAIDIAYEARENNSKWQEIFGDRKPSPEEFLETIAVLTEKRTIASPHE